MRITYFLDGKATQLGVEGSEGITEVLYPDSNYNPHEITITKMFEGYSHHRWQVTSVEHPSENEISVLLKPRIPKIPEVYLSQTHKHKKSVISNLQKGTLVEIDYGYIPSIKKSSGDLRSNKRYPDARQNGEMHKRRLAVVVNASGKRVQVVPVSSSEPPIGDRSCFSLDEESVEKLVHYNSKDKLSFVICNMIETVSLTRILPPLALPIKKSKRPIAQRSDGYPHKLAKVDMQALDKALGVTVKMPDYHDVKTKYRDLFEVHKRLSEEFEQQKELFLAQSVALVKAQEEIRQFNTYKKLLHSHYQQLHSSKTPEELQELIDEELQIMVELDQS